MRRNLIIFAVAASAGVAIASAAMADIVSVGPFPLAHPPVAAAHCTNFTVAGDDRIFGIVNEQHVAGNTVMRAWEEGRKLQFNTDNSSFGPCAGYDLVFRAFGVSSHK